MNIVNFISLAALLLFNSGCFTSEKPYTYYLLDPKVSIPDSLTDQGEKDISTDTTSNDRVVKTRWNDGKTYNEIDIPIIASGQRIIIEHEAKKPDSKNNGPDIVVPAPSASDTSHKVMHNAYLSKGFAENTKSPEVSLSQGRTMLDEAIRARNYALALQIVEKILSRYPSHAEFMRSKGSILLLLGEKSKALETYEAAQDIEFDPSVERKLKELDQ
jgi:tetratricopeptide (TPR) repeat protein